MNSISDLKKEIFYEYTIIIHLNNVFEIFETIFGVISVVGITINSINSTFNEKESTYKCIIIFKSKNENILYIVDQIKKKVNPIKIKYYSESELIYEELAFFKVPYDYYIKNDMVQLIIDNHKAKIIEVNRKYIFVEKIGNTNQIFEFLDELSQFGLVSFNRSGKIVLNKY